MYLYACASLWAVALGLNMRDQRALMLAFLVGVSIFIPAPGDTAIHFYTFCISAEIVVGILALQLRCRASEAIAYVCALLVISHIMGYALNGNPPFSPYRGIVKILEVSELLACVAFSPILLRVLRNREATTG